jgi:hypothetical protein
MLFLKNIKYINIRSYYVGLVLSNTVVKTDSEKDSPFERKKYLKL